MMMMMMQRIMMMLSVMSRLRQAAISLSGRSQPHCEGGFAQSDAMGTPLPRQSVTLTLMMMIIQNYFGWQVLPSRGFWGFVPLAGSDLISEVAVYKKQPNLAT